MLFGLIGSMLLTQPITGLINAGFMTVVAGVQADSTTGIVSFLAFIAIYAMIMTTVVHLVFSLIHWIPDNILRWIGHAAGGLPGAERGGEESHSILVGAVKELKHGASGGLGGRGDKLKSPSESPKKTPTNKDLFN